MSCIIPFPFPPISHWKSDRRETNWSMPSSIRHQTLFKTTLISSYRVTLKEGSLRNSLVFTNQIFSCFGMPLSWPRRRIFFVKFNSLPMRLFQALAWKQFCGLFGLYSIILSSGLTIEHIQLSGSILLALNIIKIIKIILKNKTSSWPLPLPPSWPKRRIFL